VARAAAAYRGAGRDRRGRGATQLEAPRRRTSAIRSSPAALGTGASSAVPSRIFRTAQRAIWDGARLWAVCISSAMLGAGGRGAGGGRRGEGTGRWHARLLLMHGPDGARPPPTPPT
jgi:hypothetical protein